MKSYLTTKDILGGMVAVAIGLFSLNSAQAQVLISLGTLGGSNSYGYGINASGQVAGYSDTSGGAQNAFLYSGGTMTSLGVLGTGGSSYGFAINASGQVAGYSTLSVGGAQNAFLYSGGTMTNLGTLAGGNSRAYGINNSGQVVGYSTGPQTAFLYSGGTMSSLGTLGGSSSFAYGINSAGQIVGWADTGGGLQEPFLYSGGTMTDLGNLGGSFSAAYAINTSGQVVGYSYTSGGKPNAFLYSGGTMSDLSTLGGSESYATDINDSGLIVGYSYTTGDADYHAFIYSSGTGLEDLNTLDAALLVSGTGPQVGFTSLTMAQGVNSSGMITGIGDYWNGSSTVNMAFLLTPAAVPEPSTWALVLGGLGLLVLWRTRRACSH